jgi:AcrR family transcriptional regulator
MDMVPVTPASRMRRQPLQARSQATELALLDAGLALVHEQGLDSLSMSAVAERAGTSIGALYFRFGDRERFVQAMLARGFDQVRDDTDQLLARAIAEHQTPAQVIGAFIELAVLVQDKSNGVFRAVLRRALDDPQAWTPIAQLGNDATTRLVGTLARFPEVTAIADWEQRVRFGVFAARTAHFTSFYNTQTPMPADRAAMLHTLQTLVVRHLGLPESPSPPALAPAPNTRTPALSTSAPGPNAAPHAAPNSTPNSAPTAATTAAPAATSAARRISRRAARQPPPGSPSG